MSAAPIFAQVEPPTVKRRLLFLLPLLGWGSWAIFRKSSYSVPDPDANGTGPEVKLILFSAAGARTPTTLHKIQKSDAEWHRLLDSEEFSITRRGGTELAYTGREHANTRPGIYRCVCCGTALFLSRDKFDSGTGWPSFTSPAAPENIWTRADRTLSVERTEVLCRKCDSHTGHVFPDGPPPTGLRYCMNGAALFFVPEKLTA